MPIYEYGCHECGHQFEETQKISDPTLKTCPKCNKEALERLISATAFVLKGGGWYKDGYGSSSGPKRSENQRADRLTKAIDDDKKKSTSSSDSSKGAMSA